jgi:peptidoglycan/LPS O-acetylase OafA/YrhL
MYEATKGAAWLAMISNFFGKIIDNTIAPSTSIKHRISGLDELRGIAALWVLVCHGTGLTTWMPRDFAGYGYHGVILFFMISGYLITKILAGNVAHQEPLKTFYIRRLIRIWPLMIVAILLGLSWRTKYGESVVFNFLLINNYAMAVNIEPVFRTDVMWSLAIEEQFYLLWPIVFAILPRVALAPFVGIIIFFGFAFDVGLIPGGNFILPKTTHASMQYIALGAAIAFGKQGIISATLAICTVFAGVIIFGATLPAKNMPYIYWYSISIAMFITVFLTTHKRPLFTSKFLAHIGRLCYSIYLLHFFAGPLAITYFGVSAVIGPLFYCITSYIFGLIAFHLIELPTLKLRPTIESSPRFQSSILLIVATTMLSSAIVAVSIFSRPS